MDLKSPSSGDCVVAADADRHESVGTDVAAEMAAPFNRITDPNRHRSRELQTECGWKQGASAAVKSRRGARHRRRLYGGVQREDGMGRKAATRRSGKF